MVVVGLIEEDVFAVFDAVVVGGEFLEDARGADAVLAA